MEAYYDIMREKLKKDGVAYISVKVVPNSGHSGVYALMTGEAPMLKIKLKAAPEKGKANAEVCAILTDVFGGAALLVSGHSSRHKLIQLTTK